MNKIKKQELTKSHKTFSSFVAFFMFSLWGREVMGKQIQEGTGSVMSLPVGASTPALTE